MGEKMPGTLDKVTAFIVRRTRSAPELLLFRHPYAGIQIPAGTVEPDEEPEQAALREAKEESGLKALNLRSFLGKRLYPLSQDRRAILKGTKVFARPDPKSFDWAFFHRGIVVSLLGREEAGFTQVSYTEWDRIPNPSYISMQITGWVPEELLAEAQLRHFFLLETEEETPPEWEVQIDWHTYTLFWSPLSSLPGLIASQDEWLEFLKIDPSHTQEC